MAVKHDPSLERVHRPLDGLDAVNNPVVEHEQLIKLRRHLLHAGKGIGLSAIARRFPGRISGQINPATVFRWATAGCRTASGSRVKLETVRVGARLLSSEAALG